MAVVSIGSVVVSAVPMGVDYGFSPVTIVPEGFQFPAGMESATPLGDDSAGAAGLKSVYPPPEPLCDVLADVFREHLVDQRLVANVSAARFLAE